MEGGEEAAESAMLGGRGTPEVVENRCKGHVRFNDSCREGKAATS